MKRIIALVFIQSCVIGRIEVPSEENLNLFNSMMTEFGTIGFWGRNDRIFLTDNEADIVVFNRSDVTYKPSARRIKFLVMILDRRHPFVLNMSLYEGFPTLAIEKMFIFNKYGVRRGYMDGLFVWYQSMFENSKIYYCSEMEGKMEIITMNTFANAAPPFWVETREYYIPYSKDSKNWAFFKREYHEETKFDYAGPNLCQNLFFDRTKILNGYTIKSDMTMINRPGSNFSSAAEIMTSNVSAFSLPFMLDSTEIQFSEVLAKYLNVSIHKTYNRPLNMILIGNIDLRLTPVTSKMLAGFFIITSKFYVSFPSRFSYDIIVTHNRALASPLEKMFEFYGWLTIIATLIILMIIFFTIYLSNDRNNSRVSFAIFECLRLLINNSLYTRMNTDKMRIFFSVIFLYFLIIQATFSGNLAAFLTKPIYRRNVEALEDLKDPRYTKIYARHGSQNYIKDHPVLLNKTTFGNYDCEKYIHDESVACVHKKDYLDHLKVNRSLHTPKNHLTFMYSPLIMRYNWPLRHRVNNLVMRLSQSGVYDFWDRRLDHRFDHELKKLDVILEDYQRPIQIEDVMFAFVLLAVGLLSAIVCFAVEYFIKMSLVTKQNL